MAFKRQRKRADTGLVGEIPMTPMIDIVFQLLVYFLVTLKPQDVIAHLDVFRPSPEATREETRTPPKMIRIVVFPDGYTINDRTVSLEELGRLLMKLAALDREQTIMIACTSMSRHENLIEVLDLCARAGLVNLSVISTN